MDSASPSTGIASPLLPAHRRCCLRFDAHERLTKRLRHHTRRLAASRAAPSQLQQVLLLDLLILPSRDLLVESLRYVCG